MSPVARRCSRAGDASAMMDGTMARGFRQLAAVLLLCVGVAGATTRHAAKRKTTGHAVASHGVHRATARGRGVRGVRGRAGLSRVRGRKVHRYVEQFTASSFVDNVGAGDVTAGEDPVVRAAAMEALGNMNGTALAIDPSSGRILAMVNQHLALSAGAEPCSTIKVAVALAALKEGLVKSDTPVNLGGHYSVDLTHALAKSVNAYFEVLGRAMGFERVKHLSLIHI